MKKAIKHNTENTRLSKTNKTPQPNGTEKGQTLLTSDAFKSFLIYSRKH